MEVREVGFVKWFDEVSGYGYIARTGGEELYVHYREIAGAGYRTLREGQQVEFKVGETDKGLCAVEVIVL